jgi:phosphoribosyl 1,2-cyclic phosphodiesterase
MDVRFWGVRGSIATPGPKTSQVGGNTSCVEVRAGKTRIVLDGGTGLRDLGDAWLREGHEGGRGHTGARALTILFSHFHWDHIQGLPFFVPAYLPDTSLTLIGGAMGGASLEEALRDQMRSPVFPVRFDELASRIETKQVRPFERFMVGDVEVTAARLNHPGGSYGYRLEHEGKALVYATDTEHYACVDPTLVRLAEGADLLIYDSQYTEDEYAGVGGAASKVGWGHSTFLAGVALARAAGVKRYALFHHDPRRDDRAVFALERQARALFPGAFAAREGLALSLAKAVPSDMADSASPQHVAPR